MKKVEAGRVAVLCDFDGTIVDVDTGALLLERFGKGNWREMDVRLEGGLISLEECLAAQFRMLKASSKEEILNTLASEKIELRPNFSKFVSYCEERAFPFVIATGGVDFCITHLLEAKGFADGRLKIHSAKSKWTSEGLEMTFPKLLLSSERSANFKHDLVKYYQGLGKKVAYFGDGVSDYEPSKEADLVFAVEGSRLSRMCAREGIECVEFVDFASVVERLDRWVSEEETQFAEKA